MAPWTPGMPWPSGTPGGAQATAWGGCVRFWLRAALAAGRTFLMGQAGAADQLDSGNVLAGGETVPMPGGGGDRLWVDMTCHVLDVEVQGGATSGQGIFARPDASTLTATIADPEGIFDPLVRTGPFAYGGRSRLMPGAPVEAFAEVVDPADGSWQRFTIFTGTADTWSEDWTTSPRQRQAKLVATDATKVWARYDRPEQSPVGQGDTVAERVNRLVEFYAWPGVVEHPNVMTGTERTLQATTLAQPGWELLNRAMDDELGIVYLTPEGHLRWLPRETWDRADPPRLTVGCPHLPTGDEPPAHDVLVDATPSNLDAQVRNSVHAARAGGTDQVAQSVSSINRFGTYDFKRTDLGLASNVQVGEWARRVVELYAFPQVGLADVTMTPGVDPDSSTVWAAVLGWQLFTDIVRVRWTPPDLPEHLIDGLMRVVGHHHRITRRQWELTWELLAARPLLYSGAAFHMGPHATDRLDSNFVMI